MKNKTESGTFQLADKNVAFRVQKNKKIKYYNLSYSPDQGLIIQVPKLLSHPEITTILKRHRRWILNRLKRANFIKDKKSHFQFQEGVELQVFNDVYKLSLKIRPGKNMFWQLKGKVLEICLNEENQNWISQIVIHWYKINAREFLYERVSFWAKKMKVNYNQIRVKNQSTIWGSCSGKNNLNFNWRIVLLTPEVADYLIVHELAHLIQLNHSSKFWKVVEIYLPNYKNLKQNIKENNYLLKFP